PGRSGRCAARAWSSGGRAMETGMKTAEETVAIADQAIPEHWRVTDPRETARRIGAIRALARARNAVLLAHNYQLPEVQEAGDFVGDSLGLSLEAQKSGAGVIVFCGVHLM